MASVSTSPGFSLGTVAMCTVLTLTGCTVGPKYKPPPQTAPPTFKEVTQTDGLHRRGEGDVIVFHHGQPASSYMWRNVLARLTGTGRLVACDLIGMGGSDKLDPSLGADRYTLANHRQFLFELWDHLNLGNPIVLVLDDWGAVLGFDWARLNSQRVVGLVDMEAIADPLIWSDLPAYAHPLFRALRSPDGEHMVLEENLFIEKVLPQAILRQLTEAEWNHYSLPFRNPGEDRRAMLSVCRPSISMRPVSSVPT